MRILRAITRPNVGGPMRQAIALWHEERARGHRTLVVTGRCESDEPAFDLTRAGIPALSLAEVLARGEGSEGHCVIEELRRPVHPLRDWRAARALRAAIRAFRPDVVHTHTSKAGVLGRRAAWREGVACVAHTFHGHVLAGYAGRLGSALARAVERRLASATDLLFAVSASCRDELVGWGFDKRIRVVPPAVPTLAFTAVDRAEARRALGIDAATPLIGFVGRMVPIKRPLLFAEVCRTWPEVQGIAIGDGPLAAALRAAPTDGRLCVLPTDPEPARIVAGLDALVLPSVREGFPIAGIEAAAAGVPTFGFDVPGLRDLDAALGGGFLVDSALGVPALVERLREAFASGAPRVDRSGAELAAACAPSRVADLLLDAYAEMLAAPRARASARS